MELQLTDQLTSKQLHDLKKLYRSAFPAAEKKPFWLICKKQREGSSEILGLIDESGRLLGEIITIIWQDLLLVDYLAIAEGARSRGYGAQALRLLRERHPDKKLLLEIETPDIPCNNLQERIRRKHFYESCGLSSMNYHVGLFGVEMEIMTYQCQVSFDEYHGIFNGVYGRHFARKVVLLKQKTERGQNGCGKKKPIFNFCLKVLLPVIILLTMLLMALTYRTILNGCNDVSDEDRAVAESGMLYLFTVLETGEEGYYYEVSYVDDDISHMIAFRVAEEERDIISYLAGSYYPTAYWYGDYQIMDLSQGYPVIESSYWTYWADTEEVWDKLDQVKVYDFSAYKGHTQDLGRGGGLALAFFWIAELFCATVLLLADLIGGIIIFIVNRERKRSS